MMDQLSIMPTSCVMGQKTRMFFCNDTVTFTPRVEVPRFCSTECEAASRRLKKLSKARSLSLRANRALIEELKTDVFVLREKMDSWCFEHTMNNVDAMKRSFGALKIVKEFI